MDTSSKTSYARYTRAKSHCLCYLLRPKAGDTFKIDKKYQQSSFIVRTVSAAITVTTKSMDHLVGIFNERPRSYDLISMFADDMKS